MKEKISRRDAFSHWLRHHWSRFILWEVRHPRRTLSICAVIVVLLSFQSARLSSRLRGGLVNLPGSESAEVLKTVEVDFSKAIAYPTILVQEGLGSVEELETSWDKSLHATRQIPQVKDVIDMHLGRKIVGDVRVNSKSFHEAQEVINRMRETGLPQDFEITENPKVAGDGHFTAAVETDVRSFKEGDMRRQLIEQNVKRMQLPEGSSVNLKVIRHPRRNFAMVETDVHSYQEAEALTATLQQTLSSQNLPLGNRVRVTGLPALFYDLNRESMRALRRAEWIGLPVCFLLLIWVFGSPLAALLPIVVALITLTAGSAIMTKVGEHMEISMFVPSVLSMIGLGVGVDYMLILLSRFRECIAKHSDVDEAIMEAMHLASPTLVGSGFTVALGFSALVCTPIMLFRTMGVAGIAVILCALVSIVLLAPPLFKITSTYISWNKPVEARTPFWRRWTQFVVDHPRLCLAGGLTLMLCVAFPLSGIKTTTINPDSLPNALESRRGYNICKNSFGAGWLMPAVILIRNPPNLSEEAYLEREQVFIRQLRGLNTTFDAIGASDLYLAKSQGFSIEIPANFFYSKSGKYHLILAMYDGNPLSVAGREWIEEVRLMGQSMWRKDGGFLCQVGGVVASTLDVDKAVRIYLIRTACFCLITTFLCLSLLYRSILIPLQAILMNLLSVSGAYGFLILWFQNGVGNIASFGREEITQGMNSIVILLLFCALFGLSMDYQVFLISRMAEEWRRSRNNRLAVRHGIELTGRVVTGAAAIMISIFLSFAFVSVLETRQFGIGMAAAITLDATIIRLLVFPSSMLLMGAANWWWPFGAGRQKSGDRRQETGEDR